MQDFRYHCRSYLYVQQICTHSLSHLQMGFTVCVSCIQTNVNKLQRHYLSNNSMSMSLPEIEHIDINVFKLLLLQFVEC